MMLQDKMDKDRKKKFTMNKNNNEYPLDLDPSPLVAKIQANKKIQLKFVPREFPEEQSEQAKQSAEMLLKYGVTCKLFFQRKFGLSKTFYSCIIMISEEATDQLQIIDTSENPPKCEYVDIFKIAEIYDGCVYKYTKQKNFRPSDDPNQWLSFYYEKSKMGIMLYFDKKEIRDQVQFAFQNLVVEHKYKKLNREENSTYDEIMAELGQHDDQQTFTFKDTKDMIQRLQLKISKRYLEQVYQGLHTNDKEKKNRDKDLIKITKRQLEKLIKTLMTHAEIFYIFENYNNQPVRELDQYTMPIDKFKHFLKTEQFENWNQKELINVFSFLSTDQCQDKLSFMGFCKLIFSKKNTLFDPNKCKYPQDMEHPITNYYINSARNIASANLDFEQYYHFPTKDGIEWENKFKSIYFLVQTGVKFLEIEVWDGGKEGPVIQYGHTMTSKCLFKDYLEKLVKHVFDNNPFPFFISIDTHCSEEQNQMVKQIIKEAIGQNLYVLPKNYQDPKKYPSPSMLKNRIIVTGVVASWILKESQEIAERNITLDSIENELQNVQYQDELLSQQKKQNIHSILQSKKNLTKPKLKSYLEKKSDGQDAQEYYDSRPADDDQQNDSIQPPVPQKKQVNKNKFVKDMSNLKACEGLHLIYGMFTYSMNQSIPPSIWEIYQITISDLTEYFSYDNKQQFLKNTPAKEYQDIPTFTKQFLVKVNPLGKKIDSNNFNPMIGFKTGAQFIINHPQSFDLCSLIYQSKFQENNGIGYVLKPPEYRDSNTSNQRSQKINVILKIVSGYQLRFVNREKVQPQIELLIIQPNESSQFYSTKAVPENHYNPVWRSNNQWKFTIEQPDISFIVFQAVTLREEEKKDQKEINKEQNKKEEDKKAKNNNGGGNNGGGGEDQPVEPKQKKDSKTGKPEEKEKKKEIYQPPEQKILLGWFAMPANSLRQGFRVIPFKDEHFCTIKNSYLLVHSEVSPRQL